MPRAFPFVIAAALVVLGSPSPSPAKPSSASVAKVERCTDASCSSASQISSGAIVTGTIRMTAQATTGELLLDRMILETLPPENASKPNQDSSWVCLQYWVDNKQPSWSYTYTWNTPVYPDPKYETQSKCPEALTHFHGGVPSRNGTFQLRVRAWDVRDENTATVSPTFTFKLANAPVTPAWASDPEPAGDAAVSLRWKPNREPDITEYRFVRVGPDGDASEFAVDAGHPAAQGCSKVGNLYFSCTDRGFAGETSGRYRYALVALRPGPGSDHRCAISGAACVESRVSATREVEVTVPASAASPSATPSLSSSPSASPTASTSASPAVAAPRPVPPADAERHEAALRSGRRLPLPLPLVAGLLAIATMAGVLYMLWKGRISSMAKP